MAKFIINDNNIQWDTATLESTVNIKTDTSNAATFILPSNATKFNIIQKDSNNLVYYDFSENKMLINGAEVLTTDSLTTNSDDKITSINGKEIQQAVKIEFQENKLILTKLF